MPRASNWVDRRTPAESKLARCLAVYLGRRPVEATTLHEEANAILQMVAADGSEVQVASFLRSVETRLHRPDPGPALRRTMAIALWHIAKAGLVRDRVVSLLAEHAPTTTSTETPLSAWLTERLESDTGQRPTFPEIARRFAEQLAAGKFVEAHQLIARSRREEITRAVLEQRYRAMMGRSRGAGTKIEVMEALDGWPTKQRGDLGWAYVAISTATRSEGVAVIVGAGGAIRQIEWGRP